MDMVMRPIATLVSCAYPFYASFKALDTKSSETINQWLTYWIVLALTIILECILETVWLLKWVPFYHTAKLGFVLWLQLPQTKGAMLLYWKLLQPQLKKHEEQIDNAFLESKRKAMRFKDWPTSMLNRSTTAADKVLQELEEGDAGEKGE